MGGIRRVTLGFAAGMRCIAGIMDRGIKSINTAVPKHSI